MNNQIVTLEKPGSVFFTAQYKLIWYKRDSAIFIENETSKSYKIQLFFDNGKSVRDYIVLPKNISNVDIYIKENIDFLMSLWIQRCKNIKSCFSNMSVVI